MIFFIRRGYWQELIESIVCPLNKLKVAHATKSSHNFLCKKSNSPNLFFYQVTPLFFVFMWWPL
jgi:hypothetical protein